MTLSNRENPVLVGCLVGVLRESVGLTIEEVAERAEVSLESIKDVEQAKELPSQEWLTKVAVCIETTAEELLAVVDKMGENEEMGALMRNFALDEDTTNLRKLIEFVQGLGQEEKGESTNGWSLRWGLHNGYIAGRNERETIKGLSSFQKCRERAETTKRELESGRYVWFMVAVSPDGEMDPFLDLFEPYQS